jgi:bifunctional ADP-heptose synthase (sugar kinase/adenylyltransferase)
LSFWEVLSTSFILDTCAIYQRRSGWGGLVVAITSDTDVAERKGIDRPINSEIQRAEVISNIKGVDGVFIYRSEFEDYAIPRIKPDIFVLTREPKVLAENIRWSENMENKYPWIKFRFLPLQVPEVSTTDMLRRASERDQSIQKQCA